MGPFLDSFFDRLGWDRTTFDRVVPHQASRLGVAQCTARWGFRPEQLVLNLPTRGNCIAASVPLALAEAVNAGDVRRRPARTAGRHRGGAEPGGGGADVLTQPRRGGGE